MIGCPGAGKSTFSRKLSKKTHLPLFYLDMIWHRPDKTDIGREAFTKELLGIMSGDSWIIDGNYLYTLPLRLEQCDTVVFFNLPVDVCMEGAMQRVGKPREDMPWSESELDPEFRQWILDFPSTQLPIIKELLAAAGPGLNVIEFRSRTEADDFIDSI